MDTQIVADYRGSLSELNSLAKVPINALTMAAEDSKEFAVQIAACIESQLKSVPGEQKLPILYLIDSICKNYPNSSYVQLFTQNIVSNFCNVFEASKEKTRRLLYKLRTTWEKAKTFPPRKLHAIDQRVHEMDPNWPVPEIVTGLTPTDEKSKTQSNQQQPQQQQTSLKSQQQQQQQQQSVGITNSTSANSNIIRSNNNNIRNKQPKTRGSKKQRTTNSNNTAPGLGQNQSVATANGLTIQLQTQQTLHPVQQPMLQPGQHTISPFYTHILPSGPQQVAAPLSAFHQPPSPNQYPAPFGFQTNDGMYSDITPMLQTQTQIPMIQQPTPPVSQQTLSQQHQHTNPPSLYSDLDMMTLESLYGGKQCSNCSLRFDDNNKYAIHLDWHFRQNLKSDTVFARRKWYYPLNLWVQFREINDDDALQENISSDNNNVNDLLISHQSDEVPTAPASKEDEKNICSVCHETFEKFWAEEEEEWRLRNARLHDDQRVYHPLCLLDMLQPGTAQ